MLSNNKDCALIPVVLMIIFVSPVALVLLLCMCCSGYLVECKICTRNFRPILKVIEAQAFEQWNLGLSQEWGWKDHH